MKLLLPESGAEQVKALWDSAARLFAARTVYVEARAALAAARRARRVSRSGFVSVKSELERRWAEIYVIDLDEPLARVAGDAAEQHGLTAGDAVHLAAVSGLEDPELVMATWDVRLRAAVLAAGLPVAPGAL